MAKSCAPSLVELLPKRSIADGIARPKLVQDDDDDDF
jgi:hypothetical protein